jgi:Trypsin-like peptidase domain
MKISLLIGLVAALMGAQSTLRKDIPAIAKAANGAIVSIIMSDKDGHAIAQGTGFLISKDGRIVTNYHVIENGSSAIVKLPDGAFFVVDGVLASDKARDVAIIKAHGENFRTLSLGNSDRLQVGEEVVAIGNPLSLESTVSNGIVSGIRTAEEEGGKFVQVTTPISPGSSGGPLFNMAGEVIGITTLYLKGGENLNFAIPINDAKRLLVTDSKVHDFPNDAEVVTAPASDRVERSSVSPNTARAFYTQLYAAGGFFESISAVSSDGKPDVLTVLDKRYVCFNDDPHSQVFFAFKAVAYDERYAKANKSIDETPLNSETPREAGSIMESIQKSAPYVDFLPDFLLGSLKAEVQAYFRRGGRVLNADFYRKGVKTSDADYEWDGNLWVTRYHTTNPEATIQTTKTFQLSIEPSTLRYIEQVTITDTAGSGETIATRSDTVDSELGSGSCEKIADKRPD